MYTYLLFFYIIRWIHGEFENLNAEVIEAEVEEFSREVFKLQKVFNARLKKMRMDLDDKKRELKKRKRKNVEIAEEDETKPDDTIKIHLSIVDLPDDVKPPAALDIIEHVQKQIANFKVYIIIYIF